MEVLFTGTADRGVNHPVLHWKLQSVTYSHLIVAVIGQFNSIVPKIVVRQNCSDISNTTENVPEIWSKSNTYDLPTMDGFLSSARQTGWSVFHDTLPTTGNI